MSWKRCSRCGSLTVIRDGYDICDKCIKNTVEPPNDSLKQMCLKSDYWYGTKAYDIYLNCCKNLGWDYQKAGSFGQRQLLYAMFCDTKRENDVWFICYSNYSPIKKGDAGHENIILGGGKEIIEKVRPDVGRSNEANRVTFIRKKDGYYFLGVYQLVENGITRRYRRISETYPVK